MRPVRSGPRRRARTSAQGACITLLVTLSACNPFSGKCSYEIRSSTATGQSQSAMPITGYVNFAQSTESGRAPDVRINLSASPTQPQTRVVLIDRRTGASLLETNAITAEITGNRHWIVNVSAGEVSDRIFSALAAGQGALRIGEAAAPVEIFLTSQESEDWVRPHCS